MTSIMTRQTIFREQLAGLWITGMYPYIDPNTKRYIVTSSESIQCIAIEYVAKH